MPLPLHTMTGTRSDMTASATSAVHTINTNTGNNIEIFEADDLRKLDIIPKDDEYILLTIPRDNEEANTQPNVLFQF